MMKFPEFTVKYAKNRHLQTNILEEWATHINGILSWLAYSYCHPTCSRDNQISFFLSKDRAHHHPCLRVKSLRLHKVQLFLEIPILVNHPSRASQVFVLCIDTLYTQNTFKPKFYGRASQSWSISCPPFLLLPFTCEQPLFSTILQPCQIALLQHPSTQA